MSREVILIIEDHDRNRTLVREVLEGTGYRTVEAETAEDGLRLAREANPRSSSWICNSPAWTGSRRWRPSGRGVTTS